MRPRKVLATALMSALVAGATLGQQWDGSQSTSGDLFRTGKVGIGTAEPEELLHLRSSADPTGGVLGSGARPGTILRMAHFVPPSIDPGVLHDWDLRVFSQRLNVEYRRDGAFRRSLMTFTGDGNVGVGTDNPSRTLHILDVTHTASALNPSTPPGTVLRISNRFQSPQQTATHNWDLRAATSTLNLEYSTGAAGAITPVVIRGPGSLPTLDVAGVTRTHVVRITGGADIAEPFEISGPATLPPGTVVSIDPGAPGSLRASSRPYDRKVAGVISGAGELDPAMLLGPEGHEEHQAVALTGRVYVLADTSNGAVAPGDLLTTSTTAGHAMRVTDHPRAQGAILGKAMSSLAEGSGLVLVLVSLQ